MVIAVSTCLPKAPETARLRTRPSSIVSTASISSIRRRPRNKGPLKGVVAMVDVRVGADAQIDCSDVVARKLRELGASTVKRLTPKLTHMVLSHFTPAWKTKIAKWQGSSGSMAAAATRFGLKVVSQLWVNACYVSKKRMDEHPFFPVSQQTLVVSSLSSTAKPKQTRRQSIGTEKRRQSLGAETSKALGHTIGARIEDSKDAAMTPLSNSHSFKALNKSKRKKRALSMEPMTSDAIRKMLGATISDAEYSTPTKQSIRGTSIGSSAKRRKTLNGPVTQQDEDDVKVSQASGIVADSESDHGVESNERVHDVAIIEDRQTTSQPSVAPLSDSPGLSASSSLLPTSSADRMYTTPTNDHKERQTARELRRHNRNSLSYGSGLMLKSGIWSCGACGCSNPRSHKLCSDCRASKGCTKSLGDDSAFSSTIVASIVADAALDTPTLEHSTQVSTTFGPAKMIRSPLVIEPSFDSLTQPTVSSAAKAQLSSPTPAQAKQPITRIETSSSATKLRANSPVVRSLASTQPMRSSLASASALLEPRKLSNSTHPSSNMKSTQKAVKKHARPPASNCSLTTPVVKKARRGGNKEATVDKRPITTPGTVSGFIRQHRDVNSTPFPMAIDFSCINSTKSSRNSFRNVFGITGVSSETRGILQCAIHAIDANLAHEKGHRRARVVKSVDYAAGVTHLIVGRDVRRTIKVLFAIARGAWIVTEDWAFSSLEQEQWLPEADYEVTIFANKYAREHPESRQIFKGMKFFVGAHVEPSREVLQSLIQVAGGEISVASICICGDAFLFHRAKRTGIRVVTSKWVFDSIATIKLEDDASYAFVEALPTPTKTPSKPRAVESFGTPALTPAKCRPASASGLMGHSTIPSDEGMR